MKLTQLIESTDDTENQEYESPELELQYLKNKIKHLNKRLTDTSISADSANAISDAVVRIKSRIFQLEHADTFQEMQVFYNKSNYY